MKIKTTYNTMFEILGNWSEAIVSLIIAGVVFIVTFIRLSERVNANKQIGDDRYSALRKDIDSIKEIQDENHEALSEVKITLAELKRDSSYIRQTLTELKNNK